MKARAKGVIKEGDTIIDGTKIISKEAKQAYSDFLRKRVKEGGDELKLREASSFAQKQTPLTPYSLSASRASGLSLYCLCLLSK
jgi:hypothetical protein